MPGDTFMCMQTFKRDKRKSVQHWGENRPTAGEFIDNIIALEVNPKAEPGRHSVNHLLRKKVTTQSARVTQQSVIFRENSLQSEMTGEPSHYKLDQHYINNLKTQRRLLTFLYESSIVGSYFSTKIP